MPTPDTNDTQDLAFYGHERVSAAEKTARIGALFANVAPRYDIMNDVMSGGLHRAWKDSFVRLIRPRQGLAYLDLAGGTGDIAFRLREKLGAGASITIADLTPDMLAEGRNRAIDRGWLDDFSWIEADAQNLPFADSAFDVVTMSFGLRNVGDIARALAEAARVLRPGGRFFCLEFSHVPNPAMRSLYNIYTRALVPLAGKIIANDQGAYTYLLDSIETFPHAERLAVMMGEAGFSHVNFIRKTFGIVAIHIGIKT